MRIAVVRLHRRDGRLRRRQPVRAKPFEDPRLQFDFGEWMAFAHERRRAFKRRARDAVHDRARLQMRFELLGSPRRLEFLHQIRRCDHALLQLAYQLDRPRVHQADVRDVVLRRILHRDLPAAGKQLSQLPAQLFPARVGQLAPCERVQRPLFDLVHQFPRLASRWYEIKPPARRHAVVSQAEDVARDRVAMVMVVEEPAVNLAGPQFGLNGFDVRHDGYGVDSKSAATCARVTPEMETRFGAALLARNDSNSRNGHLQTLGQQPAQRLVRAVVKRWRR